MSTAMRKLPRAALVPCSGIGKTYGTVGREAACIAQEQFPGGEVAIVPLALLVMDDPASRETIQGRPVLVIDGCKLACAAKMVGACGGKVSEEFGVLDAFRRHRELKPQGIAELNAGGQQLAQALGEEIAAAIRALPTLPAREEGQDA